MTDGELYELDHDRGDWLRACGDGGAVHLWPACCETWQRIPQRDRARLRGTFALAFDSGSDARVGVPLASCAVGRPCIILGRDLAPADLGPALAHELAHCLLGHVEPATATGPAVVRHFRSSLTGEAWRAALLSGDWHERPLSSSEIDRELAAWAQVARWGFDVPATWRERLAA